jgi:hypothetical protein
VRTAFPVGGSARASFFKLGVVAHRIFLSRVEQRKATLVGSDSKLATVVSLGAGSTRQTDNGEDKGGKDGNELHDFSF